MFDFLPDAEVVPLSAAPLTQVLAQVRFDNQLALGGHAGASALHDALASRYPRLLAEQQAVVTATPGGVTTSSVPQFRLTDLAGEWAVVIASEHITIETGHYSVWDELRGRLEEALLALVDVGNLRVRERVGLRYVNQVGRTADGTFNGRIRPELLGVLQDADWLSHIGVALAQTQLRDGDAQLVLRYGVAPDQAAAQGPFLLDMDCSNERPVEFAVDDALTVFDGLNDAAYRCFCWCVDVDYRQGLLHGVHGSDRQSGVS